MKALAPTDLVLSGGTLQHVPVRERLKLTAAAGFAGLSLWPGDAMALLGEGNSAADIAALIADHGLVLTEFESICSWFPQQATRALAAMPDEQSTAVLGLTAERICPLAAALGAGAVVMVETFDPLADIDSMAEGLAQAAGTAAEHGLGIVLEFIPTGAVPDLATAWAVISRSGATNVRILFDSWHFDRSGSTLELLATIPGDLIGGIQINDAPAQREADLGHAMMNARLFPGEGSLDLHGMLRTLRQIGCSAPVAVEILSDDLRAMPPAQAAAKAASMARAIVAHAN